MATATALDVAGLADSTPLSSGAKAREEAVETSGLKPRPPKERDSVASAFGTVTGDEATPLSSGAKALESALAMSELKLRPPRERDSVASLTMAPPAITS